MESWRLRGSSRRKKGIGGLKSSTLSSPALVVLCLTTYSDLRVYSSPGLISSVLIYLHHFRCRFREKLTSNCPPRSFFSMTHDNTGPVISK